MTFFYDLYILVAFGHVVWLFQRRYGDWLHHAKPKTLRARIFWSLCEQEKGCVICDPGNHSFFEF